MSKFHTSTLPLRSENANHWPSSLAAMQLIHSPAWAEAISPISSSSSGASISTSSSTGGRCFADFLNFFLGLTIARPSSLSSVSSRRRHEAILTSSAVLGSSAMTTWSEWERPSMSRAESGVKRREDAPVPVDPSSRWARSGEERSAGRNVRRRVGLTRPEG